MKPIGKIRRSQVLTNNGPGAIIDFRGENGAPVSVVAAGLDAWDQFTRKPGLLNAQCIYHERLEAKLRVKGFRLPPIGYEKVRGEERPNVLPAYRFPDWHVCPKCNLLQRTRFWASELGKPELWCGNCTSGRGRRIKKTYVVPVRFIVTCAAGHLQDFPWMSWPAHSEKCSRKNPLRLVGEGAGLKGLRVHCTECHAERDLDGALSKSTLEKKKLRCEGHSPWLQQTVPDCCHPPVAIQRGASNAYFPVIESALDVPPFGGRFQEMLEEFWPDLIALDDRTQLADFVRTRIHPRWPEPAVTSEHLTLRILELLNALDAQADDLRPNEYQMLCSEDEEGNDEFPEFHIAPQKIPNGTADFLKKVVSVERLREIRVLKAFTRLTPSEAGDKTALDGVLSVQKLNWLPAIEVRGEGIFINFNEELVIKWENRPEVVARAERAHNAAERAWREYNGNERPFPLTISPRLLLIHTTAHALAERLSLDSGYSTASIRERLYVSSGPGGMCGFLLYTSSPDSDGTLGGLSRMGRPEELGPVFLAALRDIEWCSADPLCSTGILSLSEGSGSAACHCCTFLPETSCEHFNRHLDRGMLVGSPEQPDIGFFYNLLNRKD